MLQAVQIKNRPKNNSKTSASGTEEVDVDLTALSSTMVFAEVENMTVNPDEYLEDQEKIEAAGVFKSCEVLGYTHYYMDVDDIFILE